MKFAYADPPYMGCANLYAEKQEVDHAALIERLVTEYPDGWALSLHSNSLHAILPLCPPDVRVMAWIKPWCSWKPNGLVAFAWEPVIVHGGRKRESGKHYGVKDWISVPVTTGLKFKDGRKAVGAKPEAFCRWILAVLNFQNGDVIDDLFPGTGIMASVASQMRLIS